MAEPGINVARDGSSTPATLRIAGARWVRVVALQEVNLIPWLVECRTLGIQVLLVVAKESSLDAGLTWMQALQALRIRYAGLVDAWQLLNEPDAGWTPGNPRSAAERAASGDYPSSWCLDPDDVTMYIIQARHVLGPDAYLVGPGLCSGHAEYADLVEWEPVNALAIHPYAKEPETPELDAMITAYREVCRRAA